MPGGRKHPGGWEGVGRAYNGKTELCDKRYTVSRKYIVIKYFAARDFPAEMLLEVFYQLILSKKIFISVDFASFDSVFIL